jgi:DNA-binding NarL/FixJ family response regulator
MDAAEMLSSGHSRSHSPKTCNIQILDSGSLFPHAASVILLSMHANEDYVIRGLNAGVKGYILKESVERDLPLALEAVSKRRHFFSSAISEVLLQDYIRQLKQ